MPPRPTESMGQREFLLRLRAAIDTAIKYPGQSNVDTAISLAVRHPQAMRSGHIRHNLSGNRWDWLHKHGVYPAGEAHEINDQPAIKGTLTPSSLHDAADEAAYWEWEADQ